jgi:outer membrane protein TolC
MAPRPLPPQKNGVIPHATYAPAYPDSKLLPIDLPYALRLVNTSNPTIGIARERIAQAYALLNLAQVQLVPNLWLGGNPYAPTFLPTFFHHDGLIQSSNGSVFFTDKNNFFLQAGATLEVRLVDAVFGPHIARAGVDAARARAQAVIYDVQLQVALAYLDLLRAYGALAINDEAVRKGEQLLAAAEEAVRVGVGPKPRADAAQVRAEVSLRRQERFDLQGDAAVASARLAQLLLLDPGVDLLPGDQTVVPIALVPATGPLDELIAVALLQRPELAEDRALIEQALARWRREKWAPLIPTLQAFYWGGSFIGGNPELNTAGGREDFIGQVAWEFRNAGLGDLFRAREQRAQYNVSRLRLVETQALVSAEVTAAAKVARSREQTLLEAQTGVERAEELWRRLVELAFGVGGPARQYDAVQPLLAIRALRENRLLYLDEVIEFDRQQFRLYWAMGQPPESSLPQARALPIRVQVTPSPADLAPTQPPRINIPPQKLP